MKVAGATWSYPRTLDGAQPGDEFLVYAQVPEGAPVSVAVDGSPVATPALRPVSGRSSSARGRRRRSRASSTARAGRAARRAAREARARTRRAGRSSPSRRRTACSARTPRCSSSRPSTTTRASTSTGGRSADVLEVQGSRVAVAHRADAVLPKGAARRRSSCEPQLFRPATRSARIGQLSGDGAPPAAGDPNAPVAPWGRDDSAATGHMFGGAVADSFGAGGLGLAGVGEGGGGGGEGIGLGNVGTVGHGAGARPAPVGTRVRAPAVRMGATTVSGRVPPEVIQRIVRQNFGRFRGCYENGLRSAPGPRGRVSVRFFIDRDGAVAAAADAGATSRDRRIVACVVRAFASLASPQPEGGVVTVVYPISSARRAPDATAPPRRSPSRAPPPAPPRSPTTAPPAVGQPYTGTLRRRDGRPRARATPSTRLDLAWSLARRRRRRRARARRARRGARGHRRQARPPRARTARIIDLFPVARRPAPLRRRAPRAPRHRRRRASLAVDTYAKAAPTAPTTPRAIACSPTRSSRQRDYAGAFDAIVAGARATATRDGRFRGVDRILREDLGLIAAAWIARRAAKRAPRSPRACAPSAAPSRTRPSLRFVLDWETDANDVDFHIYDADGGHAFYSSASLPSGGELYADVTTGYGPECFTIRRPAASARAPLHAAGALLLARADGLRHGQARDHRARRQRRPHASRSARSSS